jgi:hypothetical protein
LYTIIHQHEGLGTILSSFQAKALIILRTNT